MSLEFIVGYLVVCFIYYLLMLLFSYKTRDEITLGDVLGWLIFCYLPIANIYMYFHY